MHIFPQDSRYYRCGTSDGTFNNVRYFSCPDNNGLFLSLASVAKQPDWLRLEYRPKRDVSTVSEGVQKDKNITPVAAPRSSKKPSQASASTSMEANRGIINTNQLPYGTRVFIRTKDGRKVKGNIRWTGELPLEGEDPKKKVPVYGVETVSFLLGMFVNPFHILNSSFCISLLFIYVHVRVSTQYYLYSRSYCMCHNFSFWV